MKLQKISLFSALALAFVLAFSSCQRTDETLDYINEPTLEMDGNVIPGEYIVVFKDATLPASATLRTSFASREEKMAFSDNYRTGAVKQINSIAREFGVETGKIASHYTAALGGFAGELTDGQVEALKADPRVEGVYPNRVVVIESAFNLAQAEKGGNVDMSRQAAQTTPWGINGRCGVGGFHNESNDPNWLWILDTGIDSDHPDLNVYGGASYISGESWSNEQNGHGTHCAGTAAAINNSIGVVGVAAGATLIGIKVLSNAGSGATSGILSGIDLYAGYASSGDAANMSLGGYSGSCPSYYVTAIQNATAGGGAMAIAAGNSNANAANYAPACVNGTRIYTVASHDSNCNKSSFSNYGAGPVDFSAPGSNVYSTYKNGGYATLSGTSMAAPHVAGIAYARENGTVNSCGTINVAGQSVPMACL